MRPAVKLAGTPAVLGLAALAGVLAIAAAPASVAQDQPAPTAQPAPADQPAASDQSAPSPSPSAAPPVTPSAPTLSTAPSTTPAPGAAPSAAAPAAPSATAANPPDVVQDCAACHGVTKDAAAAIGPNLWGVVGRQAGSTNYDYSPAMKAYGKTWTPETLQAFIMSPATAVPGTAMSYPGVPDPATAKAVVDYLATLKG